MDRMRSYGADDVAMTRAGGSPRPAPTIRDRAMTLLQIKKDSLLDALRSCDPGSPDLVRLQEDLQETRRLIASVRDGSIGPRIYDLVDSLRRGRI